MPGCVIHIARLSYILVSFEHALLPVVLITIEIIVLQAWLIILLCGGFHSHFSLRGVFDLS